VSTVLSRSRITQEDAPVLVRGNYKGRDVLLWNDGNGNEVPVHRRWLDHLP
jgi:hypothetical protein